MISRSVFSIALGNLVSKLLGVLREILFAAWFGTGNIAAAFRIAQTGYLIPSQALVGDSLGVGLLPLYKTTQKKDLKSAQLLALVASIYGFAISIVIFSFLYIYSLDIARLIAPESNSSVLEAASRFLKVLAFSTPFFIVGGVLSYVEAAHGSYAAVAWRPIFLNLGSILGAAFAVFFDFDLNLAFGILAGHVLFFSLSVKYVVSRHYLIIPTVADLRNCWLLAKSLIFNTLPLLGLPLIAQINVWIERIVSSKMGSSLIPAVDYARFVCDTSVQLIVVPLGILTMAAYGGENGKKMHDHIIATCRLILVISVPMAIIFFQNAVAITDLLFGRGAFDRKSIFLTAEVLKWMGGAAFMTMVGYYLIRSLNAQLRNREALIFTICACVVNSQINFWLWPVFQEATIGIGVAGYSATLTVLCVWRLKLASALSRLSVWLLFGSALQLVIGIGIAGFFKDQPFWTLACCITTITFVWAGLITLVPEVRKASFPILSRLKVEFQKFRKEV